MEFAACTLLTIVTEAALEEVLVRDIEALGGRGYTITEARGKGHRGKRDAAWSPHANIRLEVLCDTDTARAICTALRERYCDNYSVLMWLAEVDLCAPGRFKA